MNSYKIVEAPSSLSVKINEVKIIMRFTSEAKADVADRVIQILTETYLNNLGSFQVNC